MKQCLHLIDELSKWSGQAIAPLALVYMAILIIEVVARYVFNAPTKWAHETSTFIFGAQFMLAGAYCFWRGSMVNVEILHDRLPLRARAILDLILSIFPLVVCGIMIGTGWSAFWSSLEMQECTQTVFGPPLYPLKAVIPVGAFLLLLQVVARFVRDLYLAINREELK